MKWKTKNYQIKFLKLASFQRYMNGKIKIIINEDKHKDNSTNKMLKGLARGKWKVKWHNQEVLRFLK